MTDASHPITTIASHEFVPSSLSQNGPIVAHQRFGIPALDGTQEDDGQIDCLCEYGDDDGWTVACDSCNKWQHQLCYYPQYEDRSLPEDLQHYCIRCKPRPFDISGAKARQQIKRVEQTTVVNGVKRNAQKTHKKKVKEPGFTTNGWPVDKSRLDRNSAGPRDQPPPAKRPKTSHRASDSNTNASIKNHSRKRNVSSANHHRRSLSRSPESSPFHLYSTEFARCYHDDSWTVTHTNLHNSIAVTNALSEWLTLPDDSFREIHSQYKTEVLMRWDGQLEDIPGKADIDIREVRDSRMKIGPGANDHPSWKTVVVQDAVASGAYIGELKGHVGFKEDYIQDPANRWAMLRHPEPFVFFHPRLPIYIDARNEGTNLRYVRRSCTPNARLQILVTDQTDYRFCFMATEQIEQGTEVALAWDTSDSLPELISRGQSGQSGISDRDLDQLSAWVSNVLANCGPCACPYNQCYMARFDRRVVPGHGEDVQPTKPSKSKRKKPGTNVSPLNTQVNSRAGSEARKVDHDDEPTDSRSVSGSAGRGSASRDLTPNTHYSHNGSSAAMPELSERERKKLAKEEEMFRRQEEEQSVKHGKKKRNSGGSNLNTPSSTSSKQLGFGVSAKYADAGVSRQAGLSTVKSSAGKRAKNSVTPKAPITVTKIVKRPRPDNYVNAQIQCDMDKEDVKTYNPYPEKRRKPFTSTAQRMLQHFAMYPCKPAREVPMKDRAVEKERTYVQQPHVPDEMEIETNSWATLDESMSDAVSPIVLPRKDVEALMEQPTVQDTEMTDAPLTDAPPADALPTDALPTDVLPTDTLPTDALPTDAQPTDTLPTGAPAPNPRVEGIVTNGGQTEEVMSTSKAPAPPWPSQASHSDMHAFLWQPPPPPPPTNKPALNMRLPIPPPPPFESYSSIQLPSIGTPNSASSLAHSPTSLAAFSIFSPSVAAVASPPVTAAVTPSSAKKKMSLSDYTRRIKTKDRDAEAKPDREFSPASVVLGASLATPNLENHVTKPPDTSSVVIDDDEDDTTNTKMDDINIGAGGGESAGMAVTKA